MQDFEEIGWPAKFGAAIDGRWVTIRGTRVFIKNGQSFEDAVEERFKKKDKPRNLAHPKSPEPASDKAARAKLHHVATGAEIQRYGDDVETKIAKGLKGSRSGEDSEPTDVTISRGGRIEHGIEVKAMVKGKDNKLTMNSYAQVRKIEWERANAATYHTVVADDRKVFSESGKHDDSKRVYYYRRGVSGSARVETMHRAESMQEVRKLINTPDASLPRGAQRTDGKLRKGRWKAFSDAQGKGFKNRTTGVIFRAKK